MTASGEHLKRVEQCTTEYRCYAYSDPLAFCVWAEKWKNPGLTARLFQSYSQRPALADSISIPIVKLGTGMGAVFLNGLKEKGTSGK